MFLATLATLNFSLSLFIGLLAAPLSFVGNPFSASVDPKDVFPPMTRRIRSTAGLLLLSPPVFISTMCIFWGFDIGEALAEAAFGWTVNGLWVQVIVWCVWWPAWLVGSILVNPVL